MFFEIILDNQPIGHENVRLPGFVNLENNIANVIARIGLKNTNELLKSFIGKTSIDSGESEKLKLITTYIVAQSISIFYLSEKDFYHSNVREYREARMACYHILKKYSGQSFAKIGEQFSQKKRNVLYFCHKCDDILTVPNFYTHFIDKYDFLERNIIDFISKLNYPTND